MSEERSHFGGYTLLEHEADIGLRCTGDCWECTFSAGGAGLLEIMAEPSSVRVVDTREIEVSAGDIGALFVSWLNELLYMRDADDMLFSSFDLRIESGDEGLYRLKASASGERLSSKRHGLKAEVKAATFSGLKYGEEGGRCFVQCLLDL